MKKHTDGLSNTSARTPLEIMFLTHFRTLNEAAKSINVSDQALRSWYVNKPCNFLKYIREWSQVSGMSFEEIIQAVSRTEDRLFGKSWKL